MLLRWWTIIIVGHVRGSNDEMTVRPSEAVRAHVILVLFEDDGPAGDEKALIVGCYIIVVAIATTLGGGILSSSPFLLPDINIANREFRLHMPPQQVINARSQNTRSASEERINRV